MILTPGQFAAVPVALLICGLILAIVRIIGVLGGKKNFLEKTKVVYLTLIIAPIVILFGGFMIAATVVMPDFSKPYGPPVKQYMGFFSYKGHPLSYGKMYFENTLDCPICIESKDFRYKITIPAGAFGLLPKKAQRLKDMKIYREGHYMEDAGAPDPHEYEPHHEPVLF